MQTAHPAEQEFEFGIRVNEKPDEAFRRIITEQIEFILKLYESDEELSFIVHNSRKSFKRIRSTLRLIRFNMPDGWFKEQNIFFRDLSMQVSEMRDAHVLMESLEILQEDPTLRINAFNTAELLQLIQKEVEEQEQILREENVLQVKHDLLQKHTVLKEMTSIGNSLRDLTKGLKSIYGEGFKSMQTAYLNPNPEHFHEWRKQVKHLLYAREILDSVWTVTAGCAYIEVKELSDMLGLDHDLANLREYLQAKADSGDIPAETAEDFRAEISKKRQKLQRLAEHLGKQIYAESDEFFIQHLDKHWKSEGI